MADLSQAKASMTQMPLFNRLKRKREDCHPTSPHRDSPAPTRTTETMSHVRAPVRNSLNTEMPLDVASADKAGLPKESQATVFQDTSSKGFPDHHLLNFGEQALDNCSGASGDTLQDSCMGSAQKVAIRDAIEAQFGLEILLKHRELRLIDQEFAKCQVGLEQLRRCQLIPYPAISGDFQAPQASNNGTLVPFNEKAPDAPLWGVADGPYSRHYQRWLIPERRFGDNVPESLPGSSYTGENVPERGRRGLKSEIGTAAGKSRSQRGLTNARLQSLPHGYPEPKEEKGPMIVKRGSDGKMVKLVCLDCRRSNFNSAQGFINHCRIAHSRQFLSHDAAIEASGEEADMDVEGTMGETNNVPQVTASSALVHPLIRSSAQLKRTTPTELTAKRKKTQGNSSVDSQQSERVNIPTESFTSQRIEMVTNAHVTPFTPSPQTPHLSALFVKLGRGGDLDDMVSQAKARVEVDLSPSSDDDDEEDIMDVAAGTTDAPQSRSTRGILRHSHLHVGPHQSPGASLDSPIHHTPSSNADKQPFLPNIHSRQSYPSASDSDDAQEGRSAIIHNSGTPFNLSPDTIEAHMAPSLVSDDGDYENTHSESESPSSGETDDDDDDHHYIHAELIDHDEMDLGPGGSSAHHIGLGGKPHATGITRRLSAARVPMSLHSRRTDHRRVNFASPVRRERRESQSSKKG